MEPTEKTVTIKFAVPLRAITEEFTTIWAGGIGKDAEFKKASKGWFFHFEGSYEAIHIGFDKPRVRVGSIARITIEVPEDDK